MIHHSKMCYMRWSVVIRRWHRSVSLHAVPKLLVHPPTGGTTIVNLWDDPSGLCCGRKTLSPAIFRVLQPFTSLHTTFFVFVRPFFFLSPFFEHAYFSMASSRMSKPLQSSSRRTYTICCRRYPCAISCQWFITIAWIHNSNRFVRRQSGLFDRDPRHVRLRELREERLRTTPN